MPGRRASAEAMAPTTRRSGVARRNTMSVHCAMRFEWDETKDEANLVKHGVDFVRARRLFDGRPVLTSPSPFRGEARWLTTGFLDDTCYTVVWTLRGEAIRLISARRARNAEERRYRSLYLSGT